MNVERYVKKVEELYNALNDAEYGIGTEAMVIAFEKGLDIIVAEENVVLAKETALDITKLFDEEVEKK
jgi:hypothetical protein